MVTVLDRPKSALERVGLGLSQGIPEGLESLSASLAAKKQENERKQFLDRLTGKKPVVTGVGLNEKLGNEPIRVGGEEFNPLEVPDALLAAAASSPDEDIRRTGETVRKLKETAQEQKQKNLEFHRGESQKYLNKINAEAETIPAQRATLLGARSAVDSGQMKRFGGDFWAGVLNIPGLKTASGAQLDASAKYYLTNSLSEIPGGRPNMFIEQRIGDAFAKAGESAEAQRSKLSIADALLDLKERKTQIADQLAQEYQQMLGYVPADISADVNKLLKPFAQQRMDRLAYELKEQQENDIGEKTLTKNALNDVPKGTPLTIKMRDILLKKVGGDPVAAQKLALRLGYTLPSPETFMR